MKVSFTEGARVDLREIGDWIDQDSPASAQRFVRRLKSACLGLSRYPRRFPVVEGFEIRGVRRRVVADYLIFYRVDDAGVLVLRVLHGARDHVQILGGPG